MCGFPPVHQVLGVAGRTTIAGGFLFSETETSDSSDPVSKGSLRRTMRQQRRTLSPQHLQQAALALSRQILQLSHYKKAQRIALYWPMQGEINPLPLMYHRLSRHKQFYLPVLSGSFAQKLRFAPFHGESRMRPNGFRIPEPQVAADLLMTPQDLDLLILPLVAFDTEGYRLGMGGGFYDRSLASISHRQHWQHPRLLGVGHAFQQLDRVPREPWDVPLSIICTDLACHRIMV
ncbi:5-formyltetrahydrofolate cyclo-ligase [Acidithiobacillus thiooxidans ATCC 19377]|jgi:5-formyltetrahydrofolate cyclo-ligase|uniref:5-formyltetrahydrofolate cyclo-ligase n=1 Tax=Acidithiobacillus thiooxidans ATCC 19377 TaxID=637390 RepID=A0A5P9XMR5_ACITH|nr:5-formyltetrahydrofolate cyclo-ligase [Acidithiobacillus thiooxidans ATCC 19377]